MKQEAVCPNNELVGQTNSPVVFGVNRLCCIPICVVFYISTLFHLALSELQYSSSIESMRSMNYIEELNLGLPAGFLEDMKMVVFSMKTKMKICPNLH